MFIINKNYGIIYLKNLISNCMADEIQSCINRVNNNILSDSFCKFLMMPVIGWAVAFILSPYLAWNYYQKVQALGELKKKVQEVEIKGSRDQTTQKTYEQGMKVLKENGVGDLEILPQIKDRVEKYILSIFPDAQEDPGTFLEYHGLARSLIDPKYFKFFQSVSQGDPFYDSLAQSIDLTRVEALRTALLSLDASMKKMFGSTSPDFVDQAIHESLALHLSDEDAKLFVDNSRIIPNFFSEFREKLVKDLSQIFAPWSRKEFFVYYGLARFLESEKDIDFFESLPKELHTIDGASIDINKLKALRNKLFELDVLAMKMKKICLFQKASREITDAAIDSLLPIDTNRFSSGYVHIPTLRTMEQFFSNYLEYSHIRDLKLVTIVLACSSSLSVETRLEEIPKILLLVKGQMDRDFNDFMKRYSEWKNSKLPEDFMRLSLASQ